MLVSAALGILIIKKAKGSAEHLLFGVMTLVLVFGDAFHLLPRVLQSLGTQDYTYALSFGTLVTSITVTIFYVLLFHLWKLRYCVKENFTTILVYALSIIRVVLCLLPQNDWFSPNPPWIWGIYRNIPFLFLGVLIIALYFTACRKHDEQSYKYLWLAVMLSFAFYAPVVIFVEFNPLFGLFMIPKTIMYVWIIWMGFADVARSK
jgi:hypothetical protein